MISSLAGRVSAPNLPAGPRSGGRVRRCRRTRRLPAPRARFRRGGCDPPVRAEDHQERGSGGEHDRYAAGSSGATRLAGTPARQYVDLGARRSGGPSRCRVSLPAIPHHGTAVAAGFAAWADRDVLVRLVDPPAATLPQRWNVILSRGPYSYDGERKILTEHAIDVILTKDSGGTHTVAKLDAAGDLGIPVVIIARPEPARPRFSGRSPRLWPGVDPSRRLRRFRVADRARDP